MITERQEFYFEVAEFKNRRFTKMADFDQNWIFEPRSKLKK